jgi:FAD:protein FMN transferase
MKPPLMVACVIWLASVVSACRGSSADAHRIEDTRLTMGSNVTLVAWASDEAATRAAFDAVFKEFDRLDGLLSVWKPGSDVSRINAAAGLGKVPVAPETMEVIETAVDVGERTGGTFDITFGALADVWKFDHDQDGSVPTDEQIAARLPLVDFRQIVRDERVRTPTLFLSRPGMRIHLGGIGKGYAVDRGVAILRDHGLGDFMIQAGGDLYVGGAKGDQPWTLGIADPRAADGPPFATLALSDKTLSTSGDYERFFMKDGVRYHHILDVRTGQPARLTRSVTLVTSKAVLADAYAKGVFILGPEEGMALIERLPDVEGVIVSAKNEVLISSGLKGKVTIAHPPTDAP